MLTNKTMPQTNSFLKSTGEKGLDKLKNIEHMSAEDLVQFLSQSLFKVLIVLGIPYFIWVFIQFLISMK